MLAHFPQGYIENLVMLCWQPKFRLFYNPQV